MFKEELAKDLAHFTSLVLSARNGELTLSEFIDAYQDFYYRYALDGHEADAEQRQALNDQQKAIEFHERIQTEVLNPRSIDEEQAKRRLDELCDMYGANELLKKLSE